MDLPLHDSTIKKIFREHFKGEIPIVKYGIEKKELISNVKNELSTRMGFEILDLSGYKYRQKNHDEICNFKIISSSKYYCSQEFDLIFDETNNLIIGKGYWIKSPVYCLEQIYMLVEKMKQEYKRLEKNYLKREGVRLKQQKIQELKHTAIIARIKEIAKEDKLRFYIEEYAKKVELIIYLGEAEEMKIDIPYDKFQETLQNLRSTIQTILKLRGSGITFQIQSYTPRYYNEPRWVCYDE